MRFVCQGNFTRSPFTGISLTARQVGHSKRETPASSTCDGGPVAVHATHAGSVPIAAPITLNLKKGISRTRQPLPIDKSIDQAHIEGLVPLLDELSCIS